MKREVTDALLLGIAPPASGRVEVWDTRVAGLVWRITNTGAASWGVRLRTADGKRTRPTLGTWPAVGVKEARKRATAAVAAIQAGRDPTAEKRQAREARAARSAEPTVALRLAEWQATRAPHWSESYLASVERLARVEIVPKLGKRPLRETTREDWTALVAAKRKASASMGAMLYRTAASFLNHAEAEGWIPHPLLPRKGAARLAPPPAPRERVLSDDELRALWRASETQAPKLRCFVRLLILTAARRDEVAGLTAGEVDRDAGLWRLPGTRAKNGIGHTMPLGDLALAELAAVWPAHGVSAGDDWRLLGAHGNALAGFSKLKDRLDRASGVSGWVFHDLRRTARTGMARLGVDRLHAERALNHISGQSGLERVYDRHDYGGETIAALSRWQAFVASLVAPSPGAEVVPLRRAAS